MRNLKKVLAVVTAAAAMFATTTSFAAVSYEETAAGVITFDYDAATNAITNLDVSNSGIAADEITILVLTDTADDTDVQPTDILYIDQQTHAVGVNEFAEKSLGLLVGSDLAATEATPERVFPVKVGYKDATTQQFTIAEGTITATWAADPVDPDPEPPVDPDPQPTTKTITVKFGDIDTNGEVTVMDGAAIISYLLGSTTKYGEDSNLVIETTEVSYEPAEGDAQTYLYGDVDTNGEVTVMDKAAIISYLLGSNTKYGTNEDMEIEVTETTYTYEAPASDAE